MLKLLSGVECRYDGVENELADFWRAAVFSAVANNDPARGIPAEGDFDRDGFGFFRHIVSFDFSGSGFPSTLAALFADCPPLLAVSG
jgi:hypothetical protein